MTDHITIDAPRKGPTAAVRVLRLLDKLRRALPVIDRPCQRIGAAILERVIRRERRRQGIRESK